MENQTSTLDEQQQTGGRDVLQEIEAPIGPTAEAIAKRIEEERARLAKEEEVERGLAVDRKRLLTKGTDAQTDECERRIDASRATQVRILERVDLLIGQLTEANAIARASELDGLEAKRRAYLDFGATLYERYDRLAAELGQVLGMLEACNNRISNLNHRLREGGRHGNDGLWQAEKLYAKIDLPILGADDQYHWRAKDWLIPSYRIGNMGPVVEDERRQNECGKQLDAAMAAAQPKPADESPKGKSKNAANA